MTRRRSRGPRPRAGLRAAAIVSAAWLTAPAPDAADDDHRQIERPRQVRRRSGARPAARAGRLSPRRSRRRSGVAAPPTASTIVAISTGDSPSTLRRERGRQRRLVAVDGRRHGARHARRDRHRVIVGARLHRLEHPGHEPAGARLLRHARAHDRLPDSAAGSRDECVEQGRLMRRLSQGAARARAQRPRTGAAADRPRCPARAPRRLRSRARSRSPSRRR